MPTPQTSLAALQIVTPVLPQNTSTLSIDSSVLPITALGDSNTTRLEVSLYNQTTPVVAYTTISGKHQFSTSVAIIQTIAETSVQMIGRNYDPSATWATATAYSVGYRYADPNGNVQLVVRATGNSGTFQPSWSLQTPTTVTKVGLSGGTLTAICNNTFTPGQKVYFVGLTNATFLNGQVVTVVTASLGQFTAAYNHADYLLTAETGTANSVTTDAGIVWANVGAIAVTPTVKFNLLFFQSNLAITIAPPSGIIAKKGQTSCTLEWVTPEYAGFIGVRVMVSTDFAGINPPYTQFGDLVTSVSRAAQTVIDQENTTQVDVPTAVISNVVILNNLLTISTINDFRPGTVVALSGLSNAAFLNDETVTITSATATQFQAVFTASDYASTPDTGLATSLISTNIVTSIQTVMTTNFSSVSIPATFINTTKFYVMFSTVIQDPHTNAMYESVQNGPLTAGFVNLKMVSPADFPVLQRKEDIAGRLIGQITRQRPDLDLSPRSEIRDIFIDPFSIEASNMAVREWFARVSQSISAITQVDDSTGTGVSDLFQSSQYKQQIARAYGLSAQDTQNLLDEQFNILGEQSGLTRGVATASTVVVTFYTYQQPQGTILIPQGVTVGTASDSNTPALTFKTTGQGVIDVANLSSFYNTQYGWWSISVPAQCSSTGSITNVGAGTIRQTVSGTPSGINVTNVVAAQYGTDRESNSQFATRIQARLVTGVDSGTRHGYLVTALSTPGIVDAQVVAAGDLEMLRDWDSIRQKHVFGTVDIYTRGTTLSQQDETVFFKYRSTGTYGIPTTYLPLTFNNGLRFQINNFNSLAYPPYSAVEIIVNRTGSTFYLNTDRAQIDTANGYIILNANDIAYQYIGSAISKARVPLVINGNPATNQTALSALLGAAQGTYTYVMYARYKSPLTLVPSLQPVLDVFSITGQAAQTGVVSDTAITTIHTSDFLLNGGSNNAGDQVLVSLISQPTTKTITASVTSAVQIDTAMDVPLDTNGVATGILSVRSTDLSTLYINGADYKIVSLGPYHTYGLQILTGSAIGDNEAIIVAYNKFALYERPTLVLDETQVLHGTLPTTLGNSGFVNNTWLPESYGTTIGLNGTALTLNGWNGLYGSDGGLDVVGSATFDPSGLVGAQISRDSRYIKVAYNNGVMDVVKKEGIDFTLSVDPVSGAATISRLITGTIPDDAVVKVSYFYVEPFTVSTQYPAFVEVLANQLLTTKHAAADVLVKAMVPNPVDITMAVTLNPNTSPEAVDSTIRTVTNIVLDNAAGTLYQSELIRQVQAITGVQSVQLPLIKCAKSDGSYDIGVVVPTGTSWTRLGNDAAFAGKTTPTNSWITTSPVLPDHTIPSGGETNAIVDFLYEGQVFRRAMSVGDFLTKSATPLRLAVEGTPGSFYIIGTNDQIDATTPLASSYSQKIMLVLPQDQPNPGNLSFLCTYQVFNEGGAKDITVSSTEYLAPGRITINYLAA